MTFITFFHPHSHWFPALVQIYYLFSHFFLLPRIFFLLLLLQIKNRFATKLHIVINLLDYQRFLCKIISLRECVKQFRTTNTSRLYVPSYFPQKKEALIVKRTLREFMKKKINYKKKLENDVST